MQVKELEDVLGDFYKLLVHPAYSESYLYVARSNNAEVKPERIEKIRATIKERIKQLKALDKELGKYHA